MHINSSYRHNILNHQGQDKVSIDFVQNRLNSLSNSDFLMWVLGNREQFDAHALRFIVQHLVQLRLSHQSSKAIKESALLTYLYLLRHEELNLLRREFTGSQIIAELLYSLVKMDAPKEYKKSLRDSILTYKDALCFQHADTASKQKIIISLALLDYPAGEVRYFLGSGILDDCVDIHNLERTCDVIHSLAKFQIKLSPSSHLFSNELIKTIIANQQIRHKLSVILSLLVVGCPKYSLYPLINAELIDQVSIKGNGHDVLELSKVLLRMGFRGSKVESLFSSSMIACVQNMGMSNRQRFLMHLSRCHCSQDYLANLRTKLEMNQKEEASFDLPISSDKLDREVTGESQATLPSSSSSFATLGSLVGANGRLRWADMLSSDEEG